ncbi:hypothetical protein E2562_023771 [Oryza meyeriana var. granulata]|uniref:Uncharacterized protein n=1 Tax=Oryza meyeriana var. granulata TaxID=110450 RepID=A0A6G1DPR4_9ORYZ|nr:hypothetical protein E2562_023771 [Oryza meyeriana var. granulata]
MVDKFHFPIGDVEGSSIKNTYSSLITSIVSRITTRAEATVEGKPVCLPLGYFDIILFPKPGSDLAANHPNGRVHLLFFYGNLYLVTFKAQGTWHKFKDLDPDIAPNYASDERKKHCKAKDIPFTSFSSMTQGTWHKFKDLDPDIAPNYASDERKKHCKTKDIPFEDTAVTDFWQNNPTGMNINQNKKK